MTIEQRILTHDGPRILDTTCSFARIWPKHATVRIDIRPETKPDIVMDAKNLDFPDNFFDILYSDPPHLQRKGQHRTESIKRRLSGRTSPGFWKRYGSWESKEQWIYFVEKTNIEFHRVLKPNGLLHYKITESPIINYDEFVSKMFNFKLIKDDCKKSRSNMGKGTTHYLTFEVNKQNR